MRDDQKGGRSRGGRGGGSRGRSRDDRFDFDGANDDDSDDAAPSRSRRRRAPAAGGRSAKKEKGKGGLFGKKKKVTRGGRSSRGEGFDWSDADDDDEYERGRRYADFADDDEDDDEEDQAPRRRRSRKAPGRQKLTLMDLCTPVFGYAAVLPQDASAPQPGYEPYREQVLTSIREIEQKGGEHGIDPEDSRHAAYAICFFMDSQVAGSQWTSKEQWAAEPLGIMIQQDAEGGVNFFKRLESLGDRQRAVKEVFLVCLALGFRGKYAELEATQQAAQIGEIRQKLVRSIHPSPMEKQPELFPEGYVQADAIEDEVPPPPRWWIFASLGTVAFAFLVYLLLYFSAGGTANETVKEMLGERASVKSDAWERVG